MHPHTKTGFLQQFLKFRQTCSPLQWPPPQCQNHWQHHHSLVEGLKRLPSRNKICARLKLYQSVHYTHSIYPSKMSTAVRSSPKQPFSDPLIKASWFQNPDKTDYLQVTPHLSCLVNLNTSQAHSPSIIVPARYIFFHFLYPPTRLSSLVPIIMILVLGFNFNEPSFISSSAGLPAGKMKGKGTENI